MTDRLDLSLIVEAYQWLKQNPAHFDMSYFISTIDGKDKSIVPVQMSPVTPECGTTFCLAGAILLLHARKEGKTCVNLSDYETATRRVFQLLKKTNPNWTGWESKMSDTLSDMLTELFMGDWHKETMNVCLEHITLPQLWQGIRHLCIAFGSIPVEEF